MRRVAAVLCTVLAGVALSAAPAAAHVELRAAAPEQDATVAVALTEVRLEFSGALQAGGAHSVGLFAPGDVRVDSGVTTLQGENVVATGVGPLTAAGPYTVRYVVVGSDGHPIEGSYGFVYDGPLVVTQPSPSPTASPSPEPAVEPSVEELESPAPLAAEPEEGSQVPVIGIAMVVVGLVAAVLVGISARRGRQDPPPRTS